MSCSNKLMSNRSSRKILDQKAKVRDISVYVKGVISSYTYISIQFYWDNTDLSKKFRVLNSLLPMIENYRESKDQREHMAQFGHPVKSFRQLKRWTPYSQTIFLCFEYFFTKTKSFLITEKEVRSDVYSSRTKLVLSVPHW